MPAPDVRYVLDGSLQFGHIAGDTHFYMMEWAANANQLVDEHEDNAPYDTHWKRLTAAGLYYENEYLKWRADNREEAKFASIATIGSLAQSFRDRVHACADKLVENKHTSLSREAMRDLEMSYNYPEQVQILRRAVHRAAKDFDGWTNRDFVELHGDVEKVYDRNRERYDQAINQICNNAQLQVGTYLANVTNIGSNATPLIATYDNEGNTAVICQVTAANITAHTINCQTNLLRMPDEAEVRRAQKTLLARQRADRKVIKRSVKFLSKLIGEDTIRLYLSGEAIRIEGRHAIYELKKTCRLGYAHGGWPALAVYEKEYPDLMLCNICLFTPNVPLLDHVASIVMHIQAGEEDQILKIGNTVNEADRAYELPWLAPHLPERSRRIDFASFADQPRTPEAIAKRRRHRFRMAKIMARHLYKEALADFMPMLRESGVLPELSELSEGQYQGPWMGDTINAAEITVNNIQTVIACNNQVNAMVFMD